MEEVIPLRVLGAFYATQLYYVVAVSALLAFFIIPELAVVVSDLFWKVFVQRRFRVVVFLLCLAGVVWYLFKANDEENEELPDLPFPPPDDDLHH